MISKVAPSFWKQYAQLPEQARRVADKNYALWLANRWHPSLRFKPLAHGEWSARVGEHYRAVGFFQNPETFIWTWIGTHEEYNKR